MTEPHPQRRQAEHEQERWRSKRKPVIRTKDQRALEKVVHTCCYHLAPWTPGGRSLLREAVSLHPYGECRGQSSLLLDSQVIGSLALYTTLGSMYLWLCVWSFGTIFEIKNA